MDLYHERADLIVAYADIVREREATLSEPAVPKVDRLGREGAHRPSKAPAKVAKALGVDKSTVTRALARARKAEKAEAGETPPAPPPPPASTEPRDLLALRRASTARRVWAKKSFMALPCARRCERRHPRG